MSARDIATLALAAFLVLGAQACSEEAAPPPGAPVAWTGDFAFGPYPIGFRSQTITRSGPEGPRELVLSTWYPAADDAPDRVLLRRYFQGILREGQLSETAGLSEGPAFAAAMTGSADALTPELARTALDAATAARANAPQKEGPFPLVLWSSRHATLLAQAPLAEVLASHGFVTATVWSSDPPLAFLWEARPAADKLATIEAHTADLERALEELRASPGVDGDNIVVLAWSYGGQTAARLQERELGVRGVVALDANVLPARPEESLELRRPLVLLVGRDTAGRGLESLQDMQGPLTALRFTELAHGSFNALEGYLPATLGTDTVYPWSQAGPVAREGYRALVRVTTSAVQALTTDSPPDALELIEALRAAAGDLPTQVLVGAADQRGGAR